MRRCLRRGRSPRPCCAALALLCLASLFVALGRRGGGGSSSAPASSSPADCEPREPIDVVYTWVNGSDAALLDAMRSHRGGADSDDDLSPSRFDDKHELRYSLRSLALHAPWIRRVYVVTAGQLPAWLDVAGDRVTVVSHEEIAPARYLPTFSSPAIECFIHRIPGLSERFLYFNDDVFLGAPVHLSDFYTPTDGYQIYTAWTVPDCARGCPWSFLGDGSCDRPCNNLLCDHDGGDCVGMPKGNRHDDPNYPIEYDESQFFDDDDDDDDDIANGKRDFAKIGYEDAALDAKDFRARQIEDERLLQKLLDANRDSKLSSRNEPNPVGRKKLSNSFPFGGELANKKNVFSEILKTSSAAGNITKFVDQFNKNVLKSNRAPKKTVNETNAGEKLHEDTRKLDAYARSLIHTNKLFNKVYGFQNRKVPAHVPFLMEKKIIEKMHEKFRAEIEVTKLNKFRRPNDFQFAFGYYYYLLHEKEEYTLEEIFDTYDTDKSGTWSDREVRTVLTRLSGSPLTAEAVHAMEATARACDSEKHRAHPTPPSERYLDSDMPTLTKKLIVECEPLGGPLRAALGRRKPRGFLKSAIAHATFAMLSSNLTRAVTVLDEIRRDTKKFICINDNLNPRAEEENEIIRMVLQELYEALFPLPSRWELPSHVANKFLRLSELAEWQQSRRRASRMLIACAMLLFVLTLYQINCCAVFRNKVKTLFS